MSEFGTRGHNSRGSRAAVGLLASLVLVGGPLAGCGSTSGPSASKTHRSHTSGGDVEPKVGATGTRDNERVLMFRTAPPLLSMVNIMVCEDGRLDLSTVREYPKKDGGFTEYTHIRQYEHTTYCDGNYLTAKGLSFDPAPLSLRVGHDDHHVAPGIATA